MKLRAEEALSFAEKCLLSKSWLPSGFASTKGSNLSRDVCIYLFTPKGTNKENELFSSFKLRPFKFLP